MDAHQRFAGGLAVLTACLVVLAAACRNVARPDFETSASASRYDLAGRIVGVDARARQLVIAHEPIEGLMPAMTMPLTVREAWAIDVAAPGDEVTGQLVVDGGRSWLERTVIQRNDGAATGGSAVPGAGPAPGATVVDVTLVNQDGMPRRPADYRGRALLLTFIYTRCPLPDYCPRLMTSFARIAERLRTDPALEDRVQLWSVSFDAEYDSPAVLREYGTRYVPGDGPGRFRRWELLSGRPEAIARLTEFFGVTVTPEADQIVHSLQTAVIAPDGTVYSVHRGSDWTPEAVLRDLRDAIDSVRAAGADGAPHRYAGPRDGPW